MHVLTHGAHHRSQVIHMLKRLGVQDVIWRAKVQHSGGSERIMGMRRRCGRCCCCLSRGGAAA
ncbi:DinB family protein [Deinococcus malanensis]|uniref:DinB family protein n=1 Tax=Deinococcus malanensis TaxID=1706855 RepID=UPI00357152A3